ncbi:hypothetical protein [Mesorhizobium qingshengii]|uniref:Uncharacterized protein n=1 Tax=Mesorhizobium qingshengii TaxID=1165689 RepID=A0A1G5YZE3_9HYPH|nr:hypothetical protein [Mesorhizobium qingshengii]SDA87876.1 hypothetical protein SAMN02927914_03983 [Mesorhizobium qingshengii]
MPSTVTLHAWATPAFVGGSPVDHTWVTTYNNQQHHYANAAAVAAAGKDYWFCWGSYHPTGGTPGNQTGTLGKQSGHLALARCLVQSNADSATVPAAQGTILIYGIDGVCHQLANQVLYATTGTLLTVKKARGYGASSFLYGTYGLRHAAWASKIQHCLGTSALVAGGAGGVTKMQGLPDDFEEHARSVLGDEEPELLAKLLSLKGEVQNFTAQRIPGFAPPSAETINARNQHLIDQAALLLGPKHFERVFGFPPGEKINLVDPSVTSRK